jgi:hypothetical protein
MQKLETTLAQLQLRAAALSDKRTAAQAALAEAITARDRHLVEGDIADEATSDKLQAKVDHYNSTVTGYEAALGTLQKQIADTEQQIAAERSAAERKAASEKLARDLDAIEKALPIYLDAARKFTKALDELHHHFEATQMAAFVNNGLAQVEVASAFLLAELRGTVNAIANGTAPMPPAKEVPAPVAAVEAPPTMTVFMIRSACFRDHEGRKRFAGQYDDAIMPVTTAQKAMRLGLAVTTADPRRGQLRGARGGDYRPDAPDVVDIDAAEEHSRVHFIGPDKSDVIAQANFTEMPRGPGRTGTIPVYPV